MIIESKEKNTILIEVNTMDLYAIRAYEKFIYKHLELKNKIPARVINKFFLFFKDKTNIEYEDVQYKRETINKIIDSIKGDIILRFSGNEEYFFDSIYGGKSFSFLLLINSLFSHLNQNLISVWDNTDYNKRKDAIIYMVNENINSYLYNCDSDTKKFFGKYKRNVLSGYIIWKFGFYLSQKLTPKQLNGKQPSNQQLYESIKYHVNKISKKQFSCN